jgi:ABC-2 type transport system ATP-binding protein
VREELLFAHRRTRRRDVDGVLESLGLLDWRRSPLADLPPAARITLLAGLAAQRPGVRALVLTSPERHGGDAAEWVRIVADLTAGGTPVLVIGGAAVAQALPSTTAALPAAPAPLLPRSGSRPDLDTSTGTNA